MNERQQKVLNMVMGLLLLGAMLFVGKEAALCFGGERLAGLNWQTVKGLIQGQELQTAKAYRAVMAQNGNGDVCVVLDPGHGGADPGKVGHNDTLEKDINLQVAMRVREYLEANNIRVVMTREDDTMLQGGSSSETHKMQDMKGRVQLIEESGPQVVVSIHQNSYPEESVHGAQVFYYQGSTEGSRLAEILQTTLKKLADPDNARQCKADNSYYLLKKVSVPTVIVECGFLTNPGEAGKLMTQEYQDRIAWAIHMGILQYLADAL